jgi:hypothetical protein
MVSVDQILQSYERFLERILFSMKICPDPGMVKLAHHLHSSYQLGLISKTHSKDFIQYLLSTTGLLHLFDVIVTSQDLRDSDTTSPSSDSSSCSSTDHCLPLSLQLTVYSQILHRLKSNSSSSLFFQQLSNEELLAHQLTTTNTSQRQQDSGQDHVLGQSQNYFHFYDLKFLSETIYEPSPPFALLNEGQRSRRRHGACLQVKSLQQMRSWWWKVGIWFGLPVVVCVVWYGIFILLRILVEPSVVTVEESGGR